MASNNLPILGVQEKKYSRTKYDFGIAYFEDNLIFKKDKSCWAIYKLINYTYEFNKDRIKLNLHNRLTKLFWNIAEEFQIIDVPIETSIDEQNNKLKKMTKGNLKLEAIKEIDRTTEILQEDFGDKGNKYETYIVIKLKNPVSLFDNIKDYAKSVIQDPARILNKITGLAPYEIYTREYKAYKDIEINVFSKSSRQLDMIRATEIEVQKLIKYLFYFGIGQAPINELNKKDDRYEAIEINGKEVIRPKTQDLMRLCECDISIEHPRRIRIRQFYKGRERTAYQAYISISNMPDLVVPDGEWHYYLKQSVDFPIYTSVRGRLIENRVAKDELNRKKREIDDQEEHIRNTQDATVPIDVIEQLEDAQIMDYEMKNKKFPLIYTSIIIAVAAADIDELQRRIDQVKMLLDPIPCEIPAGDQWLMLNECLISGEQYQKDYILRLPPDNLALLTPGASIEIGDDGGLYIGVTGSLKKPVYIAPWIASQINKAPNASFTGTQGGGKSFSCDMIVLKTAKYSGAYTLFIDPKGDRTYWEQNFSTFGEEIKVTTFTANKDDYGKLDPYIIMKSNATKENYAERMSEATTLAMDIVYFLLAIDRKDTRMPIVLEALEIVEKSNNPCMTKLIHVLREEISTKAIKDEDIIKSNDALQMAKTLTSFKNMAFAGLLFGEGDEKAVDLTKQVNVLQIQNLVFPEQGKLPENFTFQEIIGYACILAITGYIKKFIMSDKSILKMFVLDESTVMMSTPQGRNTMNSLHRMARALNSPGWFIGQSVDDNGDEKSKNNIGYKFAFRVNEVEEAKKVLKYFKLEINEANIDMLSKLGTGVCLFQDLYGRTAIVAIDAIFKEYADGLDTRPHQTAEA